LPFQTAVGAGAAIAIGASPIATVMASEVIARRIFELPVIRYSSAQCATS
jgi:hypothetical protein